jgi:hypothetical protein
VSNIAWRVLSPIIGCIAIAVFGLLSWISDEGGWP